MYKNITNDDQTTYEITKPGEYIFYFENKNGSITFNITCENASVYIYGLYQGKNEDNFILHITQNHTLPNATSQSIIKSVLDDKSIFNFTGTICIGKKAINSIAHLTNHNLLLSKYAHAITKPQLEITPSQVECTHSATTAPLNNKQISYLQSRGLSKKYAKQLLINGFINEIKKQNTP